MSEMDDLAAFAVLVEAGSFTLAAQQLGCSKGQLSKRISQLEAQFSVVLLQRTTRRLSLTGQVRDGTVPARARLLLE
eukprot:gene5054-4944_t